MDYRDQAIEYLISVLEKGYANDPEDSGGRTMFGISETNYPEEWASGPPSRERAAEIYCDIWDKILAGLVPVPASAHYLWFAVNAGNKAAAKVLQRAIRATLRRYVEDDGQIGDLTRQALFQCDAGHLTTAFLASADAYYRSLDGFSHFGRSWLRRLYYLP